MKIMGYGKVDEGVLVLEMPKTLGKGESAGSRSVKCCSRECLNDHVDLVHVRVESFLPMRLGFIEVLGDNEDDLCNLRLVCNQLVPKGML